MLLGQGALSSATFTQLLPSPAHPAPGPSVVTDRLGQAKALGGVQRCARARTAGAGKAVAPTLPGRVVSGREGAGGRGWCYRNGWRFSIGALRLSTRVVGGLEPVRAQF